MNQMFKINSRANNQKSYSNKFNNFKLLPAELVI